MTFAEWAAEADKRILNAAKASTSFRGWYLANANSSEDVPTGLCSALYQSILNAQTYAETTPGLLSPGEKWEGTVGALAYASWLQETGCEQTIVATSNFTLGPNDEAARVAIVGAYGGSGGTGTQQSPTSPDTSRSNVVEDTVRETSSTGTEPPESNDAIDPGGTQTSSLNLGDINLGGLTAEKPKDWTRNGAGTDARTVYTQAVNDDDKWTGVAPLLVPRVYDGGIIAFWAGQSEGNWSIPTTRGGLDIAARDDPVSVSEINIQKAFYGGSQPMQQPGGPPATMGAPGSLAQFGLSGIPPSTYTVRRCGKGRVMAIDGLCYLKSILPMKFRMNKTKKALLTHADKRTMQKGFRKARQLKEIAKEQAKIAKSLQPPTPRRITPRKK